MNAQITPRRVIAFVAALILVYFAGYGIGGIGAKTVMNLSDNTPATHSNS